MIKILDVLLERPTGPMMGAGALLLTLLIVLGPPDPVIAFAGVAASLGLILAGGFVEIVAYLQHAKAENVDDGDASYDVSDVVSSLQRKVADLSETTGTLLTRNERISLKKDALRSLNHDIEQKLAEHWKKYFERAESTSSGKRILRTTASSTRMRLKREIADLGRRANINLAFGVVISLSGIFFLGYSVFLANGEMEGQVNLLHVALKFGGRLSVVVVVQVFAYFFLRLYRYSLFEIKYFQNELTNSDLRFSALYATMSVGSEASVAAIAKMLANTERNFILKKGETTINLRREEIETDQEASILALIEKLGGKISFPNGGDSAKEAK